MQTSDAQTPQELEQRKTTAAAVLRWMDDEITKAPEEYIRSLDDNISISVMRASLLKTEKTGEKIPAAFLVSIDGNRLNNHHLAAAHNPTDDEGRKHASQYAVRVSKLLKLEHKLIDSDLVQYTVTPDSTRLSVPSRMERDKGAQWLIDFTHEMRDSSVAASREVIEEPMMKAVYKALQEVRATGNQISVHLAAALDNNASQKLSLSLSPSVHDAAGESKSYFEKQSQEYRKLSAHCKAKDLIAGVAPDQPQRSRG